MFRSNRPTHFHSHSRSLPGGSRSGAWRSVAWSLAACVLAASPPASAEVPPAGGSAVQQRLEQTLVDVDLDDVSFSKALEQLRVKYDLNVYMHERALHAAGIDPSTPVSLNLKQVPLATALRLLLRAASVPDAPLTFFVQDEVIVISTAADTAAEPVVRVYEVSDLIDSGFARRRIMNTPLLGLRLTGEELQGAESPGGGSARQNPFQGGGGGGLDQEVATFERLGDLIELIKETVAPESWIDAGGSGEIKRQGNRLLVRAGPVVHRELDELLALLRSERPRTIDLHVCLLVARKKGAADLRKQFAEDWPGLSAAEAARLEEEYVAEGLGVLRATTTGPSGTSQMVSSLAQEDYVAGLLPVVDESATTYQPVIGQANSGVELVVLPVLAPDGEAVNLDVSLALVPRGQIGQHTFLKNGAEELNVQLRSTGMQTLVAKVRLEAGQAILLTVPPAETAGEAAADELLLLLRPNVR